MKYLTIASVTIVIAALLCGCSGKSETEKISTQELTAGRGSVQYAPIPESILTPDEVDTRLGKLEFFDGLPRAETIEKAYDNLDFQRGVRVFLDAIPIASLYAMREGLRQVGAADGTMGIWEPLMDSKTLFLTHRGFTRTRFTRTPSNFTRKYRKS